ncbi:NADPH oxidase 4 isoform X2 [Lepisosteus oculatus]|uniref:NADPH oxidase 4 isoform X2 n=1 Tax=Lepisosteus oculatus TaxID=7918 RepID=UPI0003EAC841|nr:PREDICTED: NADPH oxidase 4 isoform X2 [Lepisosteus oculatus]
MALSCKSWLANECGKHLLLLVWLATNVWLFWKTFVLYYSGPQYFYLHKMLGLGLCVSRASASVLNLNCSLVLLPMCRCLLALIRGSQKVTGRKVRRLMDKSKTFHVACGFVICIFSVVHVVAHVGNTLSFSVRYSEELPALNMARYRGEDPRVIIFTTVPGITGVLLVVILFLMFTASSYCIRVSSYEIFWYTHNLFIVFYILLLVHVAGGVLKYQTNVDAHPPGCFRPNKTIQNPRSKMKPAPDPFFDDLPASSITDNFNRICKEEPHFQHHFPETWLWVSGPLCLYCAERLYRYIRSSAPVTIVSVVSHPCDVIEVRMVKNNFRARPGQYIVVHCPNVSSFESHPFTLTVCPTERKATFGIHLRVVGDWTARFQELLLPESNLDLEILPIVQQRRFPKDEWQHYKLRRLYFVWVCREIQSFYWFADLLCALHQKLWQENRPDYLNIKLFLSKAEGLQNIRGERYRALNSRLLLGRPRWKLLFEEIGKYNQQKCIGVFCCGPKEISKTLHKLSNASNAFGTIFEYNKESFS